MDIEKIYQDFVTKQGEYTEALSKLSNLNAEIAKEYNNKFVIDYNVTEEGRKELTQYNLSWVDKAIEYYWNTNPNLFDSGCMICGNPNTWGVALMGIMPCHTCAKHNDFLLSYGHLVKIQQ